MISTSLLKDLVASYLKIDTSDYDRFEVLNNLNAAQRHILSIMPATMISNAVKNVKGNLSADVRFYQFPNDLIRVIALWLNYENSITDSVPGRVARYVSDPTAIESYWSQPTTMYPLYGLNVEGGFEILPVPTANVTNGFRLQYIQMLPEMSDTQECMLPSQFTNLLVYYATMLSAGVEGAFPDIVALHRELFKEELEMFLPKIEREK